jgi:hypothetical protein
MQRLAGAAMVRRGSLGVSDAAPRGHPVDLARPDGDGAADAVAMHDLAGEQIGHGGKPDMRMRAHVEALPAAEFHRPHFVKKNERADHAALCRGQRPAHLKPAEIACARHDHLRNRITSALIAGRGIGCGKKAHARLRPCRIDADAGGLSEIPTPTPGNSLVGPFLQPEACLAAGIAGRRVGRKILPAFVLVSLIGQRGMGIKISVCHYGLQLYSSTVAKSDQDRKTGRKPAMTARGFPKSFLIHAHRRHLFFAGRRPPALCTAAHRRGAPRTISAPWPCPIRH